LTQQQTVFIIREIGKNRNNKEEATMKTGELAPTAVEARILRLLRALANPARFRIIALLAERKDCTAAQLAESLPLAQSSLFDHLALLREAEIVQTSSDGPNRYYCLDPATIEFLAAYLSGLGQQARSWTGLVHAAQKEQHMQIREATREDAAAIAHIYNQGIEDRAATLETLLRTPEERAEWLASRGPRHPVLVAVDSAGAVAEGEGMVVGWGSLNPFNPRPVYDHVADFSVYVAREQRGRGIGDALLGALEKRARGLGYHKMVLAAFPSNAPGMRLYERHGFQTVGVYHEQGLLDGRWVDVIIMEKLLK
jgi:L-amino acid N-acyltransferase YncA